MPQNSSFWLARGHRFFLKNGSYGYGAKSWWGPPRGHLGANGVPLGKKMGQNRKKLPCPKIRVFDYPAVIDFLQKMEVTFIARNQGRDSLGSILRPMGSHWVQKMGQYGKITMPQNSNFRRPLGHRFFPKNGSYGYGAKSQWGPPRVHLGANGVPLGKKRGQNRKKLQCPKIRTFDYPAVINFSKKKWKLRLWRQITLGTP